MENDLGVCLLVQPRQVINGEDHSGFVVRVHDRYKQGLGLQNAYEVDYIQIAARVNRQESHIIP